MKPKKEQDWIDSPWVRFSIFIIFSSIFIIGSHSLFTRCTRESGAYEARDFQIEQLKLFGVPDKTENERIKRKGAGPHGAYIHASFNTDLTLSNIFEYYQKQATQQGWRLSRRTKDEYSDYIWIWERYNNGYREYSFKLTVFPNHADIPYTVESSRMPYRISFYWGRDWP